MEINRQTYARQKLRKAWRLALLSAFISPGFIAQAQTDSVRVLDDVSVQYRKSQSGMNIYGDGSMAVEMQSVKKGIHVLGETDPLRAAAVLPGVNIGSDYSSGLSVDGTDYSQNFYSIDGAQVLFPYHFGGIYSMFNSGHVSQLKVTKGNQLSTSPYSLGSDIAVSTPWSVTDSVNGEGSVGVISSRMTVKSTLCENSSITLSARASYINALYGSLLDSDDSDTKYAFCDMNLTMIQRLSSADMIKVSGMYSNDRVKYKDSVYGMHTTLRWRNEAASVAYMHHGSSLDHQHALTYSSLHSALDLSMSQFDMYMPSSISHITGAGNFSFDDRDIDFGYRAEYTHFVPQYVKVSTQGHGHAPSGNDSWSAGGGVGKRFIMTNDATFSAGGRAVIYGCAGYTYFGVDPSVSYSVFRGRHSLHVTIDTSTQLMHQIGFSDIGLATNFYVPAMKGLPVEKSYGADFVYQWRSSDSRLSMIARCFYRRVYDCPEYVGDILGLLTDDYDSISQTVESDGFNTGFNLSASYDGDGWSFWSGYSLAMSRRQFSDCPDKWLHAANEPMHSLKLLSEWHPIKNLDLSAYFVMSSGRRYTPVKAIFIVGGNVLAEYAPRNSASLPIYHRLDLSATYHLPRIHAGHRYVNSSLNLSLINAYGHENVEMQYFTYNESNNTIRLHQVSSLYRFLPSVSYTVEF